MALRRGRALRRGLVVVSHTATCKSFGLGRTERQIRAGPPRARTGTRKGPEERLRVRAEWHLLRGRACRARRAQRRARGWGRHRRVRGWGRFRAARGWERHRRARGWG